MMSQRSFYLLALEQGQAEAETIPEAEAQDSAGATVHWVACPDLPGAYEEGPTPAAARERLIVLARRIIAEHRMRDDPLAPEIAVQAAAPPPRDDLLIVAVDAADIEEARRAPLLLIEQPEP